LGAILFAAPQNIRGNVEGLCGILQECAHAAWNHPWECF
jgi:hypothetical protein